MWRATPGGPRIDGTAVVAVCHARCAIIAPRLNEHERNLVKLIKLAVAAIALMTLTVGFSASADINEQIVERIRKVGTVCIEGHDCGVAAPATEVAQAGGSVESNYNMTCATCHVAGVAGAPKLGDVAAWGPRMEKGMDALYQSAINGMPPAMPAKGMCFNCSDDDLKALVDYMVNSVK